MADLKDQPIVANLPEFTRGPLLRSIIRRIMSGPPALWAGGLRMSPPASGGREVARAERGPISNIKYNNEILNIIMRYLILIYSNNS